MTAVRETERASSRQRSSAEIVTQPLGGGALARLALDDDPAHGELAARWFGNRPVGADAWRELARSRVRPQGWLEALGPAIEARGAAGERLERVARGDGVLVTTGQQPGLFGGPLYTWWKALSALALADEIERCSGVPAAPLFWAATDDTDFAEASWTVVAEADGARELRMDDPPTSGLMMSETPLGDLGDALDVLTRASGSASDAHVLALVRESYATGRTVGDAYVTLLRRVLEPLGIPVLDASHHVVMRRAHPLLARALESANAISVAVRARDAEIIAAGFTPQVAEVPDLSLVFARTPEGKRRIPLREAEAFAESARAGSLSPNVLLRPVVERVILPTVAYVAGPGETAYFAQATAVADALGVERPLAVARWSGAVIEPQVRAILDGFSLAPDDLADPHAAESRLARAAAPSDGARALEALRATLDETTARITTATTRDGVPMPPAAIAGLARDIGHRVNRFERRLLAAVKRREREQLRRIARARGALFPLGKRQERALNLLPMLARYGRALLEDVLLHARVHARSLIG